MFGRAYHAFHTEGMIVSDVSSATYEMGTKFKVAWDRETRALSAEYGIRGTAKSSLVHDATEERGVRGEDGRVVEHAAGETVHSSGKRTDTRASVDRGTFPDPR